MRSVGGIVLAAIIVLSIFAVITPSSMAGENPPAPPVTPNSTIRIYGDIAPKGNAPERYIDWRQPFDPTVIPKDSVTFNPAIMEWDGDKYPMSAQSENIDLKTYLRMWYEPCGLYWGPQKEHTYPTINMEYTYMLIDHQDKMPWHGDAGNTTFAFPICEIDAQRGLGAFENNLTNGFPAIPNLVNLSYVGGTVPSPYNKTVDGTIAIQKKYFLAPGEVIQFLDHKLEYIGTDINGDFAVVRVWYAGNTEDDSAKIVILPKSQTKYFKRHNEMSDSWSHDYPWFAHFEFKLQDTHFIAIDVGRYLWNSAVFYVDGVRYDVTAVEVLDVNGDTTADKFKYITIRTKLPKGTGEVMDESVVTSQYIECIDEGELIPVLPPFNMNHSIVDDIDIPLWAPLKHFDNWPEGDPDGEVGLEYFPGAEAYLTMQYPPAQWLKFFRAVPIDTDGDIETNIPSDPELWENYGGPFYPGDDLPPYWVLDECGMILDAPDNYTVFDAEHWIANDVDERIIDDVEPLEIWYIAESAEERLSTNLLEKLNETDIGTPYLYESWTKFDIQTLPDLYTEFVLPCIPDLNVTTYGDQENFSQILHGDYLITTSLIAPNSLQDRPSRGGDLTGGRVAFSYDQRDGMDGIDIYINSYPKDLSKDVTVRIYGDVHPAAPARYNHWEEPFNPTVIRKDSITFDPAILEWDGDKYPMSAQSENIDLKAYLRMWYDHCYHFHKEDLPAIVTETTYMLIDRQDKMPWHGSADDTYFAFPIAENESTDQIGLELFENKQGTPTTPNLVKVTLVSTKDDEPVGYYDKSVHGKIRIEKKYLLEGMLNQTIQFLDFKVKFLGTDNNGTTAIVEVCYAGNKEDDTCQQIVINQSETVWIDRHINTYATPQHQSHPVRTFYIHYEFKMQGTHWGAIDVGKELEWCDVFYVDGVRYEVTAIEVLDSNGDAYADKFKYITLRTPFPKDLTNSAFCTKEIDDSSWIASSQYITMIPPCHPIPVLPPFNMEHKIVDDTDVVLWKPLKHLNKWPEGDPHGRLGVEYFPCAERYLTMQYPPYAWLKYFRAVPIDTDDDMTTPIPTDWQLWENYGGPFYPGNEVPPEGWRLCECGVEMPAPRSWTVFDAEHWIANDVDERILGPIPPLEFCWVDEDKEPRFSTNLLQVLNETDIGTPYLYESWTKFDIQTLPDLYTALKLPVIPSVDPRCYVGGDYQDYYSPDVRAYPGSYLLTTSFRAPNAEGDLNPNQTYRQGNRYAFTFNASYGKAIYVEEDPPVEPPEPKIKVFNGKNYVSIPVNLNETSPESVFGDDVEVWAYDGDGGWYRPDKLEPGKGYLVRWPYESTEITLDGTSVTLTWDDINASLKPGWNLVGPGAEDIEVGDDDLLVLRWTGYEWEEVDTLRSGEGYWILVEQ